MLSEEEVRELEQVFFGDHREIARTIRVGKTVELTMTPWGKLTAAQKVMVAEWDPDRKHVVFRDQEAAGTRLMVHRGLLPADYPLPPLAPAWSPDAAGKPRL